MQLDACCTRDRLALVDERVHEVAEIGRARRSAAKWGSWGSPVSAATALTVALKISFDHCAGPQVGKCLDLEACARHQRGHV